MQQYCGISKTRFGKERFLGFDLPDCHLKRKIKILYQNETFQLDLLDISTILQLIVHTRDKVN